MNLAEEIHALTQTSSQDVINGWWAKKSLEFCPNHPDPNTVLSFILAQTFDNETMFMDIAQSTWKSATFEQSNDGHDDESHVENLASALCVSLKIASIFQKDLIPDLIDEFVEFMYYHPSMTLSKPDFKSNVISIWLPDQDINWHHNIDFFKNLNCDQETIQRCFYFCLTKNKTFIDMCFELDLVDDVMRAEMVAVALHQKSRFVLSSDEMTTLLDGHVDTTLHQLFYEHRHRVAFYEKAWSGNLYMSAEQKQRLDRLYEIVDAPYSTQHLDFAHQLALLCDCSEAPHFHAWLEKCLLNQQIMQSSNASKKSKM